MDETALEIYFPETTSGEIDHMLEALAARMRENGQEVAIRETISQLEGFAWNISDLIRKGFSPAINWETDEYCFRCTAPGVYVSISPDKNDIKFSSCRNCRQILAEVGNTRYILDFNKTSVMSITTNRDPDLAESSRGVSIYAR